MLDATKIAIIWATTGPQRQASRISTRNSGTSARRARTRRRRAPGKCASRGAIDREARLAASCPAPPRCTRRRSASRQGDWSFAFRSADHVHGVERDQRVEQAGDDEEGVAVFVGG